MRSAVAILLPVTLLAIAACDGGTAEHAPEASTAAAAEVKLTPTASTLLVALVSTDLSVGPNRLAFGLIDEHASLLRGADVQVSTFYLENGGGAGGPKEKVAATYRRWGVYTAHLSFEGPGVWSIRVLASKGDGSYGTGATKLQVAEKSLTPGIGSSAPRSVSKTLRDVRTVEEITTDPDPDADLYAMTRGQLRTRKPH